MKWIRLASACVFVAGLTLSAFAQYPGWQHEGSLFILTTPEGANLPADAMVEHFPLLVRLNQGNFDFAQARADGADLRFSSAGRPLAYQIEEWNAGQGSASIWVRIPRIQGNTHQEIKLHWGKPDAASESNGAAVFAADNGFVSVLHLGEPLQDELGAVVPTNHGASLSAGRVGKGRHFVPGQGLNCGDHITNFPCGDAPFTSEAWVRAEAAGKPMFYWGRYATRLNGKTGDGNEVAVNIDSPARFSWGSDGPGGAAGRTTPVLGQWYHVAATYSNGTSQLYVNGQLEGSNFHRAAMSITTNLMMTIGGMRGSFQFAGDLDEVRVSRVARSADWLKLEYENQKSMQTLVGTLVQPGNTLSVSPAELRIAEGQRATFTAQAGGARKVYWILKRAGAETVVAVDQCAYTLEAGRVMDDTSFVLQFKAVYADGVKTQDIPVTVQETIPEPVFSLKAPAAWNGRDTIEVSPEIANLAALQAKGVADLHYTWSISGGAVIKEIAPDKLLLKRSQCSGKLSVKLALNNGGADSAATTSIQVTEPQHDLWVQRTPGKDEQPEDNQLFARDDQDEGTLYYNGSLDRAADSVFLKLYADGQLVKTERQKLPADKSYAFTARLKPGLVRYQVEFGAQTGGAETVLRTVTNLVCGDAYIIEGQSNAEATGPNNGPAEDPVTPLNEWVRSYGNQLEGSTRGGWGMAVRTHIWGKPNYGNHQIGAWGLVLATNLVARYGIPVCFINGAIGGTPIYLHQPNPTNHFDSNGAFYGNPYKIYGSLLTRVTAAKLTHGIRAVLWHQGENDSGAGAPTGDWNYKSYQQYFIDMTAAWKQDYPNIQHYYVFQVWPLPCSMGPKDDQLREAQRTLPGLYSNLRTMSTVGIVSPATGRGMCHYDLDGYAQMARLMSPLVEQDHYGFVPPQPITAPNLKRAWFTSPNRDELALDFGQPMAWKEGMKRYLYLDDTVAPISSGSVSGNLITLKLTAPSNAKTITYLTGRDWDGKPTHLIYGANGIAALTFCEVPLSGANALEPDLEAARQNRIRWWREARFGMFIHWGLYAVPAGVWKTNVVSAGYSEWLMWGQKIPAQEYAALAGKFNPVKFNAAAWVDIAKQAGMKYMVLTAKHHEGFSMYQSRLTPYNIVDATPFKRDVTRELADACRAAGLRFGCYYSVDRDWYRPLGPGNRYKQNNLWDFPDSKPEDFDTYFTSFAKPQVEELLTRYRPDVLWFDGIDMMSNAQAEALYQSIRKLQPDCLVNSRLKSVRYSDKNQPRLYDYLSTGDNEIAGKTLAMEWENPGTLNSSYGYNQNDTNWVDASQVIHRLVEIVSKGGNYLLNVGPTAEGIIPQACVDRLREVGAWMKVNQEAIYGTSPWKVTHEGPARNNKQAGESSAPLDIRFTAKGNSVYAICMAWPEKELQVRALGKQALPGKHITAVQLLGSPDTISWRQTDDGLSLSVPQAAPCRHAFVYRVELQ